ncbi:hypothetical protein ACQCVE_04595 [Metabacillus sp. 113a]|uniref:hypothetical protein n=1 Tax=Metabacillus sp. 113a TaxID=3404706 RepID=UPI003CFA8D08
MPNAPSSIVLLLTLLIIVLVFRGMRSGTMNMTGKKLLLGLIVTILVVNVVLLII